VCGGVRFGRVWRRRMLGAIVHREVSKNHDSGFVPRVIVSLYCCFLIFLS